MRKGLNRHVYVDKDTVALILENIHGNEVGRCLIDAADMLLLTELGCRWRLAKAGSNSYVGTTVRRRPTWLIQRTDRRTNSYSFRLHSFLMNTPQGMSVDHINGDTLDNRRQNLRVVTASENNRNQHVVRNMFGVPGLRRGQSCPYKVVTSDHKSLGEFKNLLVAQRVAIEHLRDSGRLTLADRLTAELSKQPGWADATEPPHAKTHCKRGHDLSVYGGTWKIGSRYCKECYREIAKRKYLKRKQRHNAA